jgi:hypothetical protein
MIFSLSCGHTVRRPLGSWIGTYGRMNIEGMKEMKCPQCSGYRK